MMDIKSARHAAGLTLSQLSELTGMNTRQIQKYESGEYSAENMTLKNALAMAAALGVEPKDLTE